MISAFVSNTPSIHSRRVKRQRRSVRLQKMAKQSCITWFTYIVNHMILPMYTIYFTLVQEDASASIANLHTVLETGLTQIATGDVNVNTTQIEVWLEQFDQVSSSVGSYTTLLETNCPSMYALSPDQYGGMTAKSPLHKMSHKRRVKPPSEEEVCRRMNANQSSIAEAKVQTRDLIQNLSRMFLDTHYTKNVIDIDIEGKRHNIYTADALQLFMYIGKQISHLTTHPHSAKHTYMDQVFQEMYGSDVEGIYKSFMKRQLQTDDSLRRQFNNQVPDDITAEFVTYKVLQELNTQYETLLSHPVFQPSHLFRRVERIGSGCGLFEISLMTLDSSISHICYCLRCIINRRDPHYPMRLNRRFSWILPPWPVEIQNLISIHCFNS